MNDRPRAPELHSGFAWLNTDRPLTFALNGEASAELTASLS